MAFCWGCPAVILSRAFPADDSEINQVTRLFFQFRFGVPTTLQGPLVLGGLPGWLALDGLPKGAREAGLFCVICGMKSSNPFIPTTAQASASPFMEIPPKRQ